MPLLRREGTVGGPVWVRPPFVAADYAAPPAAARLFERWRGGGLEGSEALLALRDGPFGNYVVAGREVRGGKDWLVLLEASREFALEVESLPSGFGEVVPLPPERAYELACARDPLRALPVVREG
jgi:hypothetical protein